MDHLRTAAGAEGITGPVIRRQIHTAARRAMRVEVDRSVDREDHSVRADLSVVVMVEVDRVEVVERGEEVSVVRRVLVVHRFVKMVLDRMAAVEEGMQAIREAGSRSVVM